MSRSDSTSLTAAPIYIGIDLGTSGIRLTGLDIQAQSVIELRHPLAQSHGEAPARTQSPRDWQQSLQQLFKQLQLHCDCTQIRALAVDGTSGSVLYCDKNGQPVSDALMYNDARSHHEVAQLRQIPSNPVVQSVSAGLPKLLWLAEHAPNASEFVWACHQADFIASLFTGLPGHSDINNCLKSGYDPLLKRWPDWFAHFPELKHRLPQVHVPGSVIAPVCAEAAQTFGLPGDTLIVAGTTDSHAAVLATGIQDIGEAVTSLGSTLVTKVVAPQPLFDPASGIYSQPFGDHWLVGGGSNSGGAVLRHYFSDEQMRNMTPAVDADHDTGLNFYPLLTKGERFPTQDPELAPRLTPRPANDVRFFQAMLEGIARIEHQAYARLAELGAPYPKKICSVGGGASNPKWSQIRQRYCQTPITQSRYTEASYGSALLARQGYESQAQQGYVT